MVAKSSLTALPLWPVEMPCVEDDGSRNLSNLRGDHFEAWRRLQHCGRLISRTIYF